MELLIFLLGVITAVAGYMINNFIFQPLQEFKGIKAKSGYKLTYYVNIITSPMNHKIADEAEPVIRDLACDLERKYLLIPFLSLFSKSRIVPVDEKVKEAKEQLMFLSYSLHDDGTTKENHKSLEKVFSLLNIKELTKLHNKNV